MEEGLWVVGRYKFHQGKGAGTEGGGLPEVGGPFGRVFLQGTAAVGIIPMEDVEVFQPGADAAEAGQALGGGPGVAGCQRERRLG